MDRKRLTLREVPLTPNDNKELPTSPEIAPRSAVPLVELPTYRGALIGRGPALEQLSAMILEGERLITLVGPAGIGKTRLAVELASQLPNYPAAFCNLSSARSLAAACGALSRTLSLPLEGPREPAAQIGSWLRQQGPLLLILDNLEQLVDSSAAAIERWHELAREVVFLLTSRQPLGLRAERVFSLAPLSLPAAKGASLLGIRSSEAVQLFLSRARERSIEPITLERDGPLIAEVARRLDGLPLALEMAAARLEVLSLRGVKERLEERFLLLRDPLAKGRHGSLHQEFETSFALLSSFEQAALLQASVFAGGFTLQAAEQVLDPGEGAPPTMDLIQGLYRKSLLRVQRAPKAELRFGFYESLHEFTREKLAQSEEEEAAARERHARYFLRQRFDELARGTARNDPETLADIALEHDNLMAILRASLSAPRSLASVSNGLSAMLIVSTLLRYRGTREEYLALLDATVDAANDLARTTGESVDPARLEYLLLRRGTECITAGRIEEGEIDLQRALTSAQARGDSRMEGWALVSMGNILQIHGKVEEEAAAYERGLALARAGKDEELEGNLLTVSGCHTLERGKEEEAEARLLRGAALCQKTGVLSMAAFALSRLGTLEMGRGGLKKARDYLERALLIQKGIGGRSFAVGQGELAALDHLEGRLPEARAGYQSALDFFLENNAPAYEGYFFGCLGVLLLEEERLDEAQQALTQALERTRAQGYGREQGLFLSALACERALRKDTEGAEAAREEARAVLESFGDPALSRLPEIPLALLALERGELESARRCHASLADISSDDLKLALRVLSSRLKAAEKDARAWRIAEDGAWFLPPGEERVSLQKRPLLCRLLAALLSQRRRSPGQPISFQKLRDIGWPGDRSQGSSARNRVRVALSTLRKLGLDGLLFSSDTGYFLDPEQPLIW